MLTRVWITGAAVLMLATMIVTQNPARAQDGPQMLNPQLSVRTVVDGLDLPIGVAFLGPDDMLVLEKDTGRVKRITKGKDEGTVLDLGVNRIRFSPTSAGASTPICSPRTAVKCCRCRCWVIESIGSCGTDPV